MKKIIISLFILLIFQSGLIAQTTVTVGSSSMDYATLLDAFDAINAGDLQGNVVIKIIDNCVEYGTAILYESGHSGISNYTSVSIYPTVSGLSITGDVGIIDGPLIDLDGADNVTFDGRVGGAGSTIDLTITNANTGSLSSAIRFINSAENNIIKYCNIKCAGINPTGGVVSFSTSISGNGNDGNILDNNNITSDIAGRPLNAIYSSGTASHENSGNIVSNNNLFNFFNKASSSNGIYLFSNSSSWTISGNSIYETNSFGPSASVVYTAIKIDNTSGTGFTITNNFIGGQSSSSGGSAWTKTSASDNEFVAISINAGIGSSSSIQNNIIKNFTWSNSGNSTWTGINIIAGDINIGTITGNTLGASTGTGSVIITAGASGASVTGINITSTGTVDCQNNLIGAITTSNGPLSSNNFTGINKSGAGTITISNNTIGSTSTANSINANSASTSSAQTVIGISNAGTGSVTIRSNSIANLSNSTTNSTAGTAGLINGIKSTNGTNTISDNTIQNLTISNANISASNTASVCGIALTGATLKTIAGNTIYSLSNTFSSFKGSVTGIYFTGNTGANIVKENFIHSLSATGATVTVPLANIYGIQIFAGATTYANNIISLGGNTPITIYGIYETGTATNNNNIYFNSVFINGVPTSGAGNSYALYSAVTNNTRDFRNNIFYNDRSNSGASGSHYAVYLNYSTDAGLTCNYNDYYVFGTGAVLGYYGVDKASLPIVTTQDANSLPTNPAFINGGGTLPEDYIPGVALAAVAGTGILTDFNGATRVAPLTMGAFEGGSCSNPTSGGTIATAQSGCIPYDPIAFTSTSPASGYTGASLEYKWQESITDSGSGFSDIASSNSATYNAGVINQTTWYKRLARVSCMGAGNWTGAAASNVLMVTVNPLPAIELTVGGANEVCIGTSTNITVALSEAGVNYQLKNGVTNVGTAVAGNGGTINLPTGNLVTTTTFNVLATNSVTTCSSQLTQTKLVTVNPLPNTGLIVGGNTTICSGSSTNITVALSESGVNYQLRNDNANELIGTPVAGDGGTINLPTDAMTYNIQYNVLATNNTTSCSVQLTDKEIVNVYPPSVGGTISGTSSVTYGSSSGTMTVSGYTGTIQRWEKRYNSGSWTTISSTNATYSETPSSAGTWGYRAVVKSGTCSEANSAEFSITVNPKALTITAENKSKNYGAALPVLTFTYTGLVNGDLATATPPTVTTTAMAASPAGTYPITASGAADPNYTISYVAGTLTVDKVPLTITADNKSKNYGAALPVFTVTYTGLVNGDVAASTPPAVTTSATAASPAGTYPITASGAADPNYNISYVAGTLTIDKVTLTITADNKSKNYGAALPVLTFSYTGLVNGDVATATLPTVTTTATAASPAGTYPITASGAADPNYNISYAAGTLTVDKVSLTITADNKSKNYGAALPVLTFNYSGLVNGDVAPATPATVTTTATAASPSGTYPITASGAADPNYNISYVAGTLTIDKVTLTITADNKSKNYGAVLPLLTFTYTGLVNGDLATATLPTVTTTATAASPAGTYPITASGAADPNYTLSYVAGTLTVDKVALTITADNKNKNYGAALPAFTVSYSGLVNGDVAPATPATVTTTATAASPSGTYPITASGAADPNYTISYVAGTLTVDKVPLTITADNKSKNYGAALPVFTVTYSGLVNGDLAPATLPVITTTASSSSPVGSYPITPSGASDNNYTFDYIDGVLTISKSDQTITFTVLANKTYGDSDFAPAATASSGLSISFASDNFSVATISGGNIHIAGAGTAVITASQDGDGNYNSAPSVTRTLTVGKASLTFTADNKSKEFQAQNPVLTYTISGFVNGETQSVLDILPSIQTTAVQNSPKGDYPITITGGSDNNYTYIYVPGILTITKLQQTITFSDYPARLLVGDDYKLVATSSSGLPVLFESMDITLGTVSGDQLTGVSKGNVQIRAYHPGDLNWDAAEAFASVEIYSTHKDIMHLFTPNNDGFNDYWELPELAAWGKCDVRVFNRWGKLVFADPDYNNLWDGRSNGTPLPEGPYYFIIETGNAGMVKGTVNIVR